MTRTERTVRWVVLPAIAAFVAGSVTLAAQGTGQAQGQQQQTQGRAGGAGQGGGAAQGRGGQAGGRGAQRDPTAQQQQQAVGTGTISGTVTLDGSGTPVRRARVNLTGGTLRGGKSWTTDDKGQFTFVALPAGRYALTVSKAGYVTARYGAKKPGRPGTQIQLFDGQKLEKADISMPKGSVVTGIVIDESGEPAPLTQVRVMRFVTRTGERTLEQAGQGQTDDRGIYRVFGLQPGEYLVSAVPRNNNAGDAQNMMAQAEILLQQAQASGLGDLLGGRGGGGGGGGRGGGAGGGIANIIDAMGRGGGRGQQLLEQAQQLQQQAQQQGAQPVTHAPVYYPGVTTPAAASVVTLAIAEEHSGVDFQLQLVPTATVSGTVASTDGAALQGVQLSLAPQTGGPSVPGLNSNSTRADRDGKFTFTNVTPGQYTLMARAAIRPPVDPAATAAAGVAGAATADPAAGRGGRGQPGGPGGGPGGRGGPSQVLWGSADVTVAGQNIADLTLNLQTGMLLTGRIAFEATTLTPPTDLTRVRVSLSMRGQQNFDIGGIPPAQVDANGNFKITGVAPGRYVIQANVAGAGAGGGGGLGGGGGGGGGRGGAGGAVGGAQVAGSWTLKSAVVGGRDTLDFPIEVRPNEDLGGATVTFTDRAQEVSGTLQDPSGRPTPDFTIIVFSTDNRFWTPQSRRIQSARPDTTGKFTVRGLPPGDYRITAVTDAEDGEWYDPTFLQQLLGGSVTFSLTAGEKKTQDLRVAGGGH